MADTKQKKNKGDIKVDPEYEQKFYSQKITRLNKDKSEILPIKGEKNVLITSALPYVNNIPHLGNIIGCVLPADVYSRYCRLSGYNSIYVCGSDEFGTATEMAARKEGLTPREICDKYWKIHDQVYRWFDIDFDIFGRTSTEKHTKIAQDMFTDLYKNDFLTKQEMEQCYCPKCTIFLADRYVQGTCPFCKYEKATGDQCDNCQKLLNPEQLIEGACILCNTKPEIRPTKHCYLNLPKLQPKLEEWVKVASEQGNWTEVSKQITQDWLKKGLTERCITRDLKWGTPVPLEEFKDKVMYVWFDAPIGYISITANYTDEWEKWWKNPEDVNYVEFMAKDNVTFHSIIFPASQIGTGQNWTKVNHLAATHYLNYEIGKFSKRNGTGVFGDNAQDTGIPVEVWRYYLLTNRPEHSDSVFSWKDFISKNNEELLPNLGNLCQRSTKFVESKYDLTIPDFKVEDFTEQDHEFLKQVWGKYLEFIQHLENVQIKHAIKHAMEISSLGNNYMQVQAPWDKTNFESGRSKVVIGILLNFLRLLSAIFEPFTPSLSAKINFILGFEQRTEFDDKIFFHLNKKSNPIDAIIGLVKPGQKINKPVVLFKEYTKEEIEQWSLRFSGQQSKPAEEKQLTEAEKKKIENKKKKEEKKLKKKEEKSKDEGNQAEEANEDEQEEQKKSE